MDAVPAHRRRKMTELDPFPSIREELGEAETDDDEDDEDDDEKEGKEIKELEKESDQDDTSTLGDNEHEYMYFNEIAEAVGPMLDELFPPSSGVKIIAEPGRYLVAACATLVASIVSVRNNITDKNVPAFGISDKAASENVFMVTRAEEDEIVEGHAAALEREENPIIETLVEELADYSQRFARANLAQQEIDVYLDNVQPEATDEVLADAPEGAIAGETQVTQDGMEMTHTVEGMQAGIVVGCADMFDDDASAISGRRSRAVSIDHTLDNSIVTGATPLEIPCVLAAAGEAAVSGIVRQAIADSVQPLQDDFAYYINDGVYGAFNNLLFDHATVRPRKLRDALSPQHQVVEVVHGEGENALRTIEVVEDDTNRQKEDENLYSSTVFGPTCDSMDVLSRGVLLPKMDIGDWMYFQNMGAYTSAAASTFNGFPTTDKFYVCSVKPQHFTRLVTKGRVNVDLNDEKKEER